MFAFSVVLWLTFASAYWSPSDITTQPFALVSRYCVYHSTHTLKSHLLYLLCYFTASLPPRAGSGCQCDTQTDCLTKLWWCFVCFDLSEELVKQGINDCRKGRNRRRNTCFGVTALLDSHNLARQLDKRHHGLREKRANWRQFHQRDVGHVQERVVELSMLR